MKHDAGLPVAPARVTEPAPPDDAAADASRPHRARYAWPIGAAYTHASFDIETRTAPDGRMTTWRYRAQAAGAGGDCSPQLAAVDLHRSQYPAGARHRARPAAPGTQAAGPRAPENRAVRSWGSAATGVR
ncbi:hypothetical protein M3583_22300, partial [Bacillus subtilis]|nr:hypothetical protein [Bacillus subtilis]